ncbi:MAG: hypothetical protein R2836_08830 [Chitinophagales bacterium]|nr:hypothetical protein [Bacteroidota bacterium]MCB9226264.1 hypothetical protein [Chitinophagales bacterium]
MRTKLIFCASDDEMTEFIVWLDLDRIPEKSDEVDIHAFLKKKDIDYIISTIPEESLMFSFFSVFSVILTKDEKGIYYAIYINSNYEEMNNLFSQLGDEDDDFDFDEFDDYDDDDFEDYDDESDNLFIN